MRLTGFASGIPAELSCLSFCWHAPPRSWLERQQSCPTCRTSVMTARPDSQQQQQGPAPEAAIANQPQQEQQQPGPPQVRLHTSGNNH